MRRITSKISGPSALSINDVVPANIPELVGFWKCSDVASDTIPDHSGNGYDLTHTWLGESPTNIGVYDAAQHSTDANWFIEGDNFVLPSRRAGFTVDVTGTSLLPQQNQYVIYACEVRVADTGGGSSDFDWGGAMLIGHAPADAAPQEGMQFGGFGFIGQMRYFLQPQVSNVWMDVDSPASYGGGATGAIYPGFASSGDVIGMCCAFVPSSGFMGAVHGFSANGEAGGHTYGYSTTPPPGKTVPDTLIVQNNLFGFRTTSGGYYVGASPGPGCKNLQAWHFSSEPPRLADTVKWLAANPGKIPSWWVT